MICRCLLVLAVLISGYSLETSANVLVCNSCTGSICPRLIPDKIGRCRVELGTGKCFIRKDPSGETHYGCVTPRIWRARSTERDGCRLHDSNGESVIFCLCSHQDRCNTNVIDIISRSPTYDAHDILQVLAKQHLVESSVNPRKRKYQEKAPAHARRRITGASAKKSSLILPDAAEKTAQRPPQAKEGQQKAENLVLNDKSIRHDYVPKLLSPQSSRKQSYTILEKYYNEPSVNNIVHGADSKDAFIPKYRDCRIHNGYCEHVCVMGWNGMGYCACHSGYRLGKDLMTCDDIDECQTGNGGCEQECHNEAGYHYCTCLRGYSLATNNQTCQEIDECSTPYRGGCTHGCTNLPGSYQCTCPAGFQLQKDYKTCEDTDECTAGVSRCQQLCTNTEGAYTCGCTQGFVLAEDGYSCLDLDECAVDNGGCSQECINSLGTYACACRMGYDFVRNNTRHCVDIDECAENNGGCEHYCFNTDGYYNCSCALGYGLMDDNRGCRELIPGDKCVKNNGGCDHDCHVIDASTVRCTCYQGYELLSNNKACVDHDECTGSPCAGRCVNTPGSFRCECGPGQTLGLNGTCMDINECDRSKGGCDHICVNTDGSYFCACTLGFWLDADSHSCIDIDECQMDNGGCTGICENSLGSYNCSCAEGFIPDTVDSKHCIDIDECATLDYGGCQQVCVNTAGSYVCGCADGYRLADDRKTCADADECLVKNGGCEQQCVNTQGSFTCQCYNGYARDYFGVCQDVDECYYGIHNCTTMCVNTPGSFECVCPIGYKLNHNQTSCEDRNECLDNNGGCDQYCLNMQGSYRCACAQESGYMLSADGHNCHVICPDRFTAINQNDSCMQLQGARMDTFEDAEEYCRRLHEQSHLATVESLGKFRDISALLHGTNISSIWTAGKYWQPISDFIWITSYDVISGVNMTIPIGQSSLHGTCVALTTESRQDGRLVPQDCGQTKHFACEIKWDRNQR